MTACLACSADLSAVVARRGQYCPYCGALAPVQKSPSDPNLGRSLLGKYTLLEKVGEGGMGRVYRATQDSLGRTVAMKLMHPELAGHAGLVERFMVEARAASALTHPHSVSIVDFGQSEQGVPFLVMEFLQGKTLGTLLRGTKRLSFDRAISITRQVLLALGAAHELGIVHRDLKPQNIMLQPVGGDEDYVKVVDFGLAVMWKPGQVDGRIDGHSVGTPTYMAPEQAKGLSEPRSDLYAVGVLLYRMLCSQLPFASDSPADLALMHASVLPTDPRQVAPERCIPAGLATIALKALSKQVSDRFQSAADFVAALDRVVLSLNAQTEPNLSTLAGTGPELANPIACGHCGEEVHVAAPSCPFCGAPTARHSTAPPALGRVASSRPAEAGRYSSIPEYLPLLERDEPLGELLSAWAELGAGVPIWSLHGKLGTGRSRLAKEFAKQLRSEPNTAPLWVSADPWRRRVSMHGLRRLLRAITSAAKMTPLSLQAAVASSEARQGLGILAASPSALSAQARGKGAIVEVLARALHEALLVFLSRSEYAALCVIWDDWSEHDALSRQVLQRLWRLLPQPRVAWLTIDREPVPEAALQIRLGGLSPAAASRWLAIPEGGGSHGQSELRVRAVPPLVLEHQARLQRDTQRRANGLFGDVIAARLARLSEGERYLLAALGALGSGLEVSLLKEALPQAHLSALAELDKLVRERFVDEGPEGQWSLAHPSLRSQCLASLGNAERRALWKTCAQLLDRMGAPLEVRAQAAADAGSAVQALVLYESLASRYLSFGDLEGASMALSQGLAVARTELLVEPDGFVLQAAQQFVLKLAKVLARKGETAGAEGVLREALDWPDIDVGFRRGALAALAETVTRRASELPPPVSTSRTGSLATFYVHTSTLPGVPSCSWKSHPAARVQWGLATACHWK